MALIPTVLILRRLLQRNLFPLLYALIGLFLVGNLRVITASLPVIARFFFLVQMLGGFCFLIWLVRSGLVAPKPSEGGNLSAAESGMTKRFSQALYTIAKIGLVVFPIAILANLLGYTNLGTLPDTEQVPAA